MKIFGLVAIFLIVAVIDIPYIAKKTTGKLKCFAAYGFILITGFSISLLQVIEHAPVSPSKVIQTIVKGIMGDL